MELRACVVVAQDEAIRDFLAAQLKASGMEAVLLTSLREVPGTVATLPVCGLLLELASLVTASPKDKKATEEFLEFYPHAKFRFDHQQVLMVGETLDQFFRRCLQFQPRVIRQSIRKILHLAILLSAHKSFTRAEKAVTVNVSERGTFVYSARRWKVGQCAWLKLPDREDSITGIVRYYQPWGSSELFPGIGIEIDAKDAGWLAACKREEA